MQKPFMTKKQSITDTLINASKGGCRREEKSRKHWSLFTKLLSLVTAKFFFLLDQINLSRAIVCFDCIKKNRPTPISRVRDLQTKSDLEWLRMTFNDLEWPKMTKIKLKIELKKQKTKNKLKINLK